MPSGVWAPKDQSMKEVSDIVNGGETTGSREHCTKAEHGFYTGEWVRVAGVAKFPRNYGTPPDCIMS